jgi:hypothetical protein
MPIAGKYRGGVLVLPGGKPQSTARSHPLQLTNQRVEWLARSLRRRLGSGVLVRRVQYQVRGWNSAELDALEDCGDRPRLYARALRRRQDRGSRSLDGRASGRPPVCERRRRRGGRAGDHGGRETTPTCSLTPVGCWSCTARLTLGPILTRPIGRPFVPATAASTPSGCRLRRRTLPPPAMAPLAPVDRSVRSLPAIRAAP